MWPEAAPRVLTVQRVGLPTSRLPGVEVEVSEGGYRFRLLVRAGRVLWPHLRGEEGVTPEDPARRARIEAAVLEAAGGLAS